jgi:hypothetical protein
MPSVNRAGRILGGILLVEAVATSQVYARLLPPVTAPTFLTTAAPHATAIRIALLLSIGLSTTTFLGSLMMLPIVRPRSERLAIAYVALSVIGMATMAAESIGFRNLLALSLEYAKPGAPIALLQTMGAVARSTALSTHFTNLLVGHATMLVLYLTVLRLSLVPRGIPIAGLVASLIGIPAVSLPLLGGQFSFLYVVPAGVAMLTLIVWLLAKGFAGPVAIE